MDSSPRLSSPLADKDTWSAKRRTADCALSFVAAVEVDELDQRRVVEINSLLRGDFLQRVVNVRQMIGGDVAHEGAGDFFVAHAAMQPAQEDDELHDDGNERGEPAYFGHEAGTIGQG